MDEWPLRKVRRTALPHYEHPVSIMEDMNRQMANTLNKMQEFVDDFEHLDEFANRLENKRRQDDAVVKRTETGGLQLSLNVTDFKPEELKIKLVDDHLVVEAENETSGENSYRKSHFKRWFRLPEDCKVDEIKSKLTADDKLVIDLPLNKPIESNARSIPIEVAKKPAVTQNGNQQSENQTHGHEDQGDNARRSSQRQ